ncbi:DsbA family oxidoreductase [Aspergillus thermomutatus]|uniref:DSBA-like thioredoxin domain-containing protein n=1 Tax=Aspergillus thermomutatus TaxID=41047 RepID=A0A397GF22_ASPTH|nr:uncharacterized protein CDV56_104425 [Aspergillus thermomutatus]RHZ46700.1 hypothetical protein CDV56_104425 [Aspergillus thermomutatus]
MAIIEIEIVSDVICPWCYIASRNLQKAITLYKKTYPDGSNDSFSITWTPYFIDQVPPAESILVQGMSASATRTPHHTIPSWKRDKLSVIEIDRMLRRMTPEQVSAAQTRLKRVGAASGIQFKFGGYVGSSRLAHRLLHLVKEKKGGEVQDRLAEMLFHYQFEREADVSEEDVVVEAGGRVGLGEEEVRGWLATDEGVEEIEEQGRQARDAGVQGVPHIIVGGQHHFDGALDVSEFFEAVVLARQSGLSRYWDTGSFLEVGLELH